MSEFSPTMGRPQGGCPNSGLRAPSRIGRRGLTLIEMLIAMALTLIMMAAVVTVFANVSKSVANRRSSIEMTSQLRHVRGVLERDLAGATCPGVPWQRTDSNHGYISVAEGPQCDFDPSLWLQDRDDNGELDTLSSTLGEGLDLTTSSLPASNLGILPGKTTPVTDDDPLAVTDGRGLGDWDDILMLTVRNENEPFVGRVPDNVSQVQVNNGYDFPNWGQRSIDSQLAEVVWFALENPVERTGSESFYFGEPGLRTVYRRALLIAPWLNYGFVVPGANGNQITGPGVVRVLSDAINLDVNGIAQAMASVIAFQDRYDLSVRLDWDPTLGVDGRWVIAANSLADLTKRENRYEHFGHAANALLRRFPYPVASAGAYGVNGADVAFVLDPEYEQPNDPATFEANIEDVVTYYTFDTNSNARPSDEDQGFYPVRPFAFVDQIALGDHAATARAITNESGRVIHVTHGLAPLGGARRGEDVMLTNALGFDLKVMDPKAPLLAEINDPQDASYPGVVVRPGDAGWGHLLQRDGVAVSIPGRGAYVDLGYYSLHQNSFLQNDALGNWPAFAPDQVEAFVESSLFAGLPAFKSQMIPGQSFTFTPVFTPFRTYDTWSFHYENNGVNEDDDEIEAGVFQEDDNDGTGQVLVDEGTNGFDDVALYEDASGALVPDQVLGPDDYAERETSPPYDTRLRGVQVTLRAYEIDSRQIREVKVSGSLVPK